MTSHACERVAPLLQEFALGLLDPDEAGPVVAHLERCEVCTETTRHHRDQMSVLAEAYAEQTPSPALGDRVWAQVEQRVVADRARLEAETAAAAARWLPEGSLLVPAASGGWRDTSVPGVRCRVLHEDPAQDRRTALYQMEPGSEYPAHIHGGVEECYVLSGDLWQGDLRMGPGDYQRVEGESKHLVQSTREGCMLLITCSMSDRFDVD
ncbi:MAG: cupin domain-containing protein [Planctomycetota bacterium]